LVTASGTVPSLSKCGDCGALSLLFSLVLQRTQRPKVLSVIESIEAPVNQTVSIRSKIGASYQRLSRMASKYFKKYLKSRIFLSLHLFVHLVLISTIRHNHPTNPPR
jgi:hypothetical protein